MVYKKKIENILIVEDDITLSLMLKTWLTKKGFSVDTSMTVTEAKRYLQSEVPDLVLCDLRLPDASGLDLLKFSKQQNEKIVFIMMTGYADIQTAVSSIKFGAFDYVAKPLNPEELLRKINEATEVIEVEEKVNMEKQKQKEIPEFVVGTSVKYKKIYEYVDLVAPTKMSVLITGNSGVGKEHIARLIHQKSDRSNKPFVAVDCGVLNKELSASDFFGHVKGAFTGAINNKQGHFLFANGGTLFLDEIGNLPMDIQVQLLRVLEEKKIKQVGSEKEIPVDIRLISATNEDLSSAMGKSSFRPDLYHRLSEFLLNVPSLSECPEDISLYLHHFLEKANQELNKNIIGFKSETLEALKSYSWPGNVRELKNIVSRMVLLATEDYIVEDLLPESIISVNNK